MADPIWAKIAREEDADDVLASFRDLFSFSPEALYLDGNSLGLLSRPAEAAVLRALDAWKRLAVEGWTTGEAPWFFLAETLGAKTAALIGAAPDEVIVANSTTVNLHQLLATLFQPSDHRHRLLADAFAFPSDLYALRSHLKLRGCDPKEDLVFIPGRDGLTLDEEEIIAGMTDDVQIAVLPSVLYVSGQLLDVARLTEEAHRRGVLIGFDCSHSIGVVPHQLDAWGVDFAFWCSYKYLNGGPGASGGLYLNRRHFDRAPGMAGWWGGDKARQFDMAPDQTPAYGAGSLQIGTPNIMSMAALEGALETLLEAGVDRLRSKSLALTGFLLQLADELLAPHGFQIATPRETKRRGGHLSLRHPEAARIVRALRRQGVIPDFRPPDIVRLAPVPLYTRFSDCLEAVERLVDVMEKESYLQIEAGRELVP